jgi:hypothetical protein
MNALSLRPRSATEIIDASFQLLRRHYASFAAAAAAVLLPALVLRVVLPDRTAWLPNLLAQLLQSTAAGATIVLVSDAYLGRVPNVGEAVRLVFRRFGSIFFAALIQGLVIGVGVLLLLVPGLIFAAWTFAMPMVVVLEGRGALDSLGRSRELARGQVGHILGTLVIAYVIFFVVFFIGLALLAAVAGITGAFEAGPGQRTGDVSRILFAILAHPIVAVVGTLLYYDLRIRKEGFDLEMMARDLDANTGQYRRVTAEQGLGRGARG